uniref:Uncharacterized protein n=1 Tax=Romanomermis culicivorax TaxID=13658 RepID=A0A915L1E8_ROMCU
MEISDRKIPNAFDKLRNVKHRILKIYPMLTLVATEIKKKFCGMQWEGAQRRPHRTSSVLLCLLPVFLAVTFHSCGDHYKNENKNEYNKVHGSH